jgi:hypothetical protein
MPDSLCRPRHVLLTHQHICGRIHVLLLMMNLHGGTVHLLLYIARLLALLLHPLLLLLLLWQC